jgi:hypothetical protein
MPIELHATCDRRIAETEEAIEALRQRLRVVEAEAIKLRAVLQWTYTACLNEIEQVPGLEDAVRPLLKLKARGLDEP